MAEEQPQSVAVSIDIMNAVLEFLQRQPFGQVHQLIDAIKNDAKPVAVEDSASNDVPASE